MTKYYIYNTIFRVTVVFAMERSYPQALLLTIGSPTIAFVQDRGVFWDMGLSGPKLGRFSANQNKFITLLGFRIHPVSDALAPTFAVAADMEF